MNKWTGSGRLTRDPDIRYSNTANGQIAVARFTLAVDRRGRRNNSSNEQTADFLPCVAFGSQAEFCEKYLRKGIKMEVVGRIQTGSYTNKDGVRVSTFDIIVEELEFAESKSSGNGNNSGQNHNASNGNGNGSRQYQQQDYHQQSQPEYNDADFMNIPEGIDDAGLPFN